MVKTLDTDVLNNLLMVAQVIIGGAKLNTVIVH